MRGCRALSVDWNPVTDPSANTAVPSRSSVHDDGLPVFSGTRGLELNPREVNWLSKTATCIIFFI